MLRNNTPRCSPCYTATVAECAGEITLAVQLNPNTTYWCRLTDKFGNRLLQQIQTDEDGSFTLDLQEPGPERFMAASGSYLLQVYQQSNSCTAELLNFCGDLLDCLYLDFVQVSSTSATEPQVIPCPCSERQ